MKRGLVGWDRSELPESALAARIERIRGAAATAGVPAVVLYADVWRSNRVRHATNFMPFWGRSLLVVPASGEPVLVCGHSPRVYPWLRTVTTVADIRPAADPGPVLKTTVAESGWRRVGVLDAPRLPFDVARALAETGAELVPMAMDEAADWLDPVETAMRRRAAESTRRLVEAEIALERPGETEYGLAARIDRALRLQGMEDVVLWVTEGRWMPRPASAALLAPAFSVVVAAEYRGHWVMLSRTRDAGRSSGEDARRFTEAVRDLAATVHGPLFVHDLGGDDSFRARPPASPLRPGEIVAVHVGRPDGTLLLHGDTTLATGPFSAAMM